MNDYYKSFGFYVNVFLFVIIVYLIIINRYYQKELDFHDFIKIYEIGEDDFISSEINIRKKDGSSCKMISEFPDNEHLEKYNKRVTGINEVMEKKKSKTSSEKEFKKVEKERIQTIRNLGNPPLVKNIRKKGDCI